MAILVHLWSGDTEAGLWCPKCNLPSGIRVPVFIVSEQGVSPLKCVEKCSNCGAKL